MLRADKMMREMTCLIQSKLDHLLRSGSQFRFPFNGLRTRTDNSFNGLAYPINLNTQVAQRPRSNAPVFAYQPQQQMLRADVAVPQTQRLLLRQRQNTARAHGEKLELPLPEAGRKLRRGYTFTTDGFAQRLSNLIE